MTNQRRLIAEWEPQQCVAITWPDELTDWRDMLDEVLPCYRNIACEISRREELLIICRNIESVRQQLNDIDQSNITFIEAEYNDTWIRDYGAIAVEDYDGVHLLDFQFNGWGLKYAANNDNMVTRQIYHQYFKPLGYIYEPHLSTVLEGGSIETDGQGLILSTFRCLADLNRNGIDDMDTIGRKFSQIFSSRNFHLLAAAYLAGDDTDGHIDQLVRLTPKRGQAIVMSCDNFEDKNSYYSRALSISLENVLHYNFSYYDIVELPLPSPIFDPETHEQLPASYANYLIINGAVLLPVYDDPQDQHAVDILASIFPDREIVPINCLPLIRQRGSLHCATMQFPIPK